MLAFVDEAGVSAATETATDHFIVSAVVIRNRNVHRIIPRLDLIRAEVERPGRSISWKDIRSHSQRLHAVQSINNTSWLRTITVVVCKRSLERNKMSSEERYQWTLRLLLERLSWLARAGGEPVHTVVSHIRGFEPENLARYQQILQGMETKIAWKWLDPAGCEVVSFDSREELQLADIVASAASCAFEQDRYGNTERRYLREMRTPMWDNDGGALTTYGLKVHPARALDSLAYRWIKDL
jgi:hypothetical protein